MSKRIIVFLVLILCFVGCNQSSDEVTRCYFEPIKSSVYEFETERTLQAHVYHKNGIASKSILIEQYVIDPKGVDRLLDIAESFKLAYDNEEFNYNGFYYDHEIKENILTITIILNYKEMDMRELVERKDKYTGAADIVDDNFNVSYDKLITSLTKVGFTCEK